MRTHLLNVNKQEVQEEVYVHPHTPTHPHQSFPFLWTLIAQAGTCNDTRLSLPLFNPLLKKRVKIRKRDPARNERMNEGIHSIYILKEEQVLQCKVYFESK